MKRKRFSDEQITSILKQAEPGTPIAELRRIDGVSEARELKQLREENIKLKRLVADLSLDRRYCSMFFKTNLKSVKKREMVNY